MCLTKFYLYMLIIVLFFILIFHINFSLQENKNDKNFYAKNTSDPFFYFRQDDNERAKELEEVLFIVRRRLNNNSFTPTSVMRHSQLSFLQLLSSSSSPSPPPSSLSISKSGSSHESDSFLTWTLNRIFSIVSIENVSNSLDNLHFSNPLSIYSLFPHLKKELFQEQSAQLAKFSLFFLQATL